MRIIKTRNIYYLRKYFTLSFPKQFENHMLLRSHYFFYILYFFNRSLYKKDSIYSSRYLEATLKRFFFV